MNQVNYQKELEKILNTLQEKGEAAPDALPPVRIAPPVETAEGEDGQGDAPQPAEVEGVEVGEAHPGGDGVHGIQKVLHSAASGDDSSGKRLLPAYHNPGEKPVSYTHLTLPTNSRV